MNIQRNDKKYLGRERIPRPLIVTKSSGSYLYDISGKKYIDFSMGWCVGNIGWSVKEIVSEIKKFNGPTYVNPGYYYNDWVKLAELLAKITPNGLIKTFRATGGTEAVEIALQAAMSHTKRYKFISIEGSYHGHSIGAMSIGSSKFRSWYRNLLPHCYKIKPPLNEEAAMKVEQLLRKKGVAAFIAEPIICNLTVEIPDRIFFDIVQAACKRNGTLFIADEVATGFGRTGKMFASEYFNLKPDIMCLAKGITGGHLPMGATIMTKEVAQSFEFEFSFYSTFGWHPLSVTAAIANIKYFIKNKKMLLSNASQASQYIEQRFQKMRFAHPPNIRIKGLAVGVTFLNNSYAKEIIDRCLEKGLLLAPSGTDFIILPSLDISEKILKTGLDILEQCL